MRTVLAFLTILGFAMDADCDGCRRVQYQQTYYQQTYTPSYNYVASVYVPQTVFPVFGIGYGSADELRLLREGQLQQQELINQLVKRELDRNPVAPDQPLPPVMPPQQVAPKQRREVMPQPKVMPQGLKASPFQDAKFVAFVKAACIKCHGSAPVGNKVSFMLNIADVLVDVGEGMRNKMVTRVVLPTTHPAHMPKGGEAVPDDVLELFVQNALAK